MSISRRNQGPLVTMARKVRTLNLQAAEPLWELALSNGGPINNNTVNSALAEVQNRNNGPLIYNRWITSVKELVNLLLDARSIIDSNSIDSSTQRWKMDKNLRLKYEKTHYLPSDNVAFISGPIFGLENNVIVTKKYNGVLIIWPIKKNRQDVISCNSGYSVNAGAVVNNAVYTDSNLNELGVSPKDASKQCTVFTNNPQVNFMKSVYHRYVNWQTQEAYYDMATDSSICELTYANKKAYLIDQTHNQGTEYKVKLKSDSYNNHGTSLNSGITHLGNIVLRAHIAPQQSSTVTAGNEVTSFGPAAYFKSSFGQNRGDNDCELVTYLLFNKVDLELGAPGMAAPVKICTSYGRWMMIWSEMSESESGFDTLKKMVDCTGGGAVFTKKTYAPAFTLPLKFGNVCNGAMPLIPIAAASEVTLVYTHIGKEEAVALFDYKKTTSGSQQAITDSEPVEQLLMLDPNLYYSGYRLDECALRQHYLINNTHKLKNNTRNNDNLMALDTDTAAAVVNESNAQQQSDSVAEMPFTEGINHTIAANAMYFGFVAKNTKTTPAAATAGTIGIKDISGNYDLHDFKYKLTGLSEGGNRLSGGHEHYFQEKWKLQLYENWSVGLRPSNGVHRHGWDLDACANGQPTGVALLGSENRFNIDNNYKLLTSEQAGSKSILRPYVYVTHWEVFELNSNTEGDCEDPNGFRCGPGYIKKLSVECFA